MRQFKFLMRALLALTAIGVGAASAQEAFYRPSPGEIAGPPGTIIRKAGMPFAPAYVTAYRVLYRSVGLNGEPIAVSGVVIAPTGAPPPGGRPVVAWAHPTTGVTTRCAPSRAFFLFQQIQGLRDSSAAVTSSQRQIILASAGPASTPIWSARARRAPSSITCARRGRFPRPAPRTLSPSGVIRRAVRPRCSPA